MSHIHFFTEDVDFNVPKPLKTKAWLKEAIRHEKHQLKELNFIFCSDEYLLKINIEYLNHNTYTDIVTFDNSEEPRVIEGDIFVSIDRVKENATKFDHTFEDEFHRVLIHGVLHLLGYSDKKPAEKSVMRGKEDAYLSLRK